MIYHMSWSLALTLPLSAGRNAFGGGNMDFFAHRAKEDHALPMEDHALPMEDHALPPPVPRCSTGVRAGACSAVGWG